MRSSTPYNLFIFVISTFSIASVAFSCGLTTKWNVSVISAIGEDIVAHIKSGDDDLGNHTIPYVGIYSWSFCENFGGGTVFYGYFWWGSKFQSLALIDNNIERRCYFDNVATQRCYWFVKPDGFYVSRYPNGGGELIKHWD
ncbi:hypothetical protein LXL04_022829 [Taraxacum kok-saghyz]